MLHAPLQPTVAKLDISRLLESSPSPQSRQVAREFQEESHVARSASDPPPAKAFPSSSQRSSVSSTRSGNDSFTVLSASSLPPQLPVSRPNASSLLQYSQLHQSSRLPQQQSHSHQRPPVPSMSALPLSTTSLPPLNTRIHTTHSLSGSSLSETAALNFPQAPKRSAPSEHTSAPPAKRQSKWTAEEDALVIELRGAGMKWEDISKRIPGRTPLSCRLHYQNYIERRSQWDEDRKNRLARLYERLKPEMWKPLAAELNVPWRAAEAMHWQLGQVEMARRAGVTPFSISSASSGHHGSRLEGNLTDASPTAGFPPISPYVSVSHSGFSYAHPVRQSFFDDRDSAYRTSSQNRPRSVSASSGEERRGSGTRPPSAAWTSYPSTAPPGRQADGWPLPRLSEVNDSKGPVQDSEYRPSRHFNQGGSS